MQPISEADIKVRIARDNPWWDDPAYQLPEAAFPRRVYFVPLKTLALDFSVRRATVLLGPRRVGKTVMIKQLVVEAIASGIDPKGILYVSIDTPIYSGISLQHFLDLVPTGHDTPQRVIIFDEIQVP